MNGGDEEATDAADILMQNLEEEEEEAEEDDDDEMRRSRKVARKHGGSRPGKAQNLRRDFEGAHKMVLKHYFNGTALLYDESTFERRFGCPRVVVDRVWGALHGCDPFILKTDGATKIPGIRLFVRFVACKRMLVYLKRGYRCWSPQRASRSNCFAGWLLKSFLDT